MKTESAARDPSQIPGGLRLNYRRNPIKVLSDAARKYGDVCYVSLGKARFYLLSNPSYIQRVLDVDHRQTTKGPYMQRWRRLLGQGLVASEGDLHHRQRRLIIPAFHNQRIRAYAEVVGDYTSKVTAGWKDGEVLDIHKEMARLTLSVIAKTLFGADIWSESDWVGEALSDSIDYYDRLGGPTGRIIGKLPLPESRRYERAERRLNSLVYKIIGERRVSGRDEGDMLSMLLSAESKGEGVMTDSQVRDETITFILVGHETTAVALSWTWYLLSGSPAVEAKLHDEVDRVLEGGRGATMADIPNLTYTNKVLTESMRIFPPIWVIGRTPTKDYSIGGYVIPSRSIVLMSQYVAHHDPRFYPKPDLFNPDRWTPEMEASLPKYAYFPFGGGPRACIGESFAWMEATLVLASIARRWRLIHDPTHRVMMAPKITLRPKNGMRMKVVRRPPSPA